MEDSPAGYSALTASGCARRAEAGEKEAQRQSVMHQPGLPIATAAAWLAPVSLIFATAVLAAVAVGVIGGHALRGSGVGGGTLPRWAAAPAGTVSLVVKDPLGGYGSPLAKRVVLGMDTNINLHFAWNDWEAWSAAMAPYWTEDCIYDFNYVGEWGFGPTRGLRAWFEGEHLHFNAALPDCQFTDFIRAATNQTATSASYGLARWTGPFAGVPPPTGKPWVKVRDLDFYLVQGDRIKVNWCIIDVVDIFNQAGYAVLPPAPMDTDGYIPPRAMDGFPAPLSAAVDPADTVQSEKVWRAALDEDLIQNSGGARWWDDRMVWYGPGGIGTAHSRSEYQKHFLEPLHAAFSGITMDMDMVVCEGKYCGAHFYLRGRHTGTWLGQPATGKEVPLRFGAHARIDKGRIVEGWLIIDIPRAFAAMDVDLYARARALALGAP